MVLVFDLELKKKNMETLLGNDEFDRCETSLRMDSHCRDNSKGGHTHLAPKIIGSSRLKCENIEGQRQSTKTFFMDV